MVFWVVSERQRLPLETSRKDTDNGGGEDGKDGSNGDGALGIFQIPRAVRTGHDPWREEEKKTPQLNHR